MLTIPTSLMSSLLISAVLVILSCGLLFKQLMSPSSGQQHDRKLYTSFLSVLMLFLLCFTGLLLSVQLSS